MRFLIIDDNPIDAETAHRLIKRLPGEHQVWRASDGEQGLKLWRELIKAPSPLIVLLDLWMEPGTGEDFLRQAHREDNARIFVFSACPEVKHKHVDGTIDKHALTDKGQSFANTITRAWDDLSAPTQDEHAPCPPGYSHSSARFSLSRSPSPTATARASRDEPSSCSALSRAPSSPSSSPRHCAPPSATLAQPHPQRRPPLMMTLRQMFHPLTAIPPSPKRPRLLLLLGALLMMMILTFSSTSNAQRPTASFDPEADAAQRWEDYKRACDGYRAASHERRGERDEARRGEASERERASACEIEDAIEDDRHDRALEDARKETRRARIIGAVSTITALILGVIIGTR